jgi:CRISPR/Cas system-associated exonuclease Cas4 (RecB family)
MSKKLKGKVKEVWESKLKQKPSENKHISYSQLSSFATCQRQWYLQYVKKLAPYQPSIHAVFGTAMHETIQSWLETMYHGKVKDANDMNLDQLLYDNIIKAYKANKAMNSHQHFSSSDELTQFWIDGKHILNYLKKKRGTYFSTKTMMLAGVETLLYQELRPGVQFKGFIDLVFYHPISDTWTIMDIKTSTSGWRDEAKKDEKKIAQILLYKEFFAQQFDIDIEKIDVEYFILQKRVPQDAEYAAMERRVQTFRPPSGKIKRGKALSMMNEFVETAVDQNGEYIDREYPTNPSKWGCNFCAFKEMRICPDAVL